MCASALSCSVTGNHAVKQIFQQLTQVLETVYHSNLSWDKPKVFVLNISKLGDTSKLKWGLNFAAQLISDAKRTAMNP